MDGVVLVASPVRHQSVVNRIVDFGTQVSGKIKGVADKGGQNLFTLQRPYATLGFLGRKRGTGPFRHWCGRQQWEHSGGLLKMGPKRIATVRMVLY